MAEPTVAVLGAGRMGSAMAERLARPGRRRRRLQPLAGPGARRWPSGSGRASRRTPAEAAAAARTSSISMVADDAAVRALYDGPDGVPAGIRPGPVAVDMSTVLPDTIRAIAPAVRGPRRRHPRRAGVGQRRVDAGRAS